MQMQAAKGEEGLTENQLRLLLRMILEIVNNETDAKVIQKKLGQLFREWVPENERAGD
jgi:hypothetical protein